MFIAHPGRAFWNEYMADTLRNAEEYGLAGFEIIGAGISGDGDGGIGELGLKIPFLGASDSHGFGPDWTTFDRAYSMVFSKNRTDLGLVDSIINRRTVAYCGYLPSYQANCTYYMADEDWLNEYGRRNSSLTNAIAGFSLDLNSLSISGMNIDQASNYVGNATSNQMYQNLRRAREFLIKAMNDIYTIDVNIGNTTGLRLGDTLGLSFNVENSSGITVSGATIQLILYDESGSVVDSKIAPLANQAVSTTLNLPSTGIAGEYFLWYNVSIGKGFYEERVLFIVDEPEIQPSSTSTIDTSLPTSSTPSTTSSPGTTSSPETTPGFTILFTLSSLVAVIFIVNRRKRNNF